MSYGAWTDGVTSWTASDAEAMQAQTTTRFETEAARDIAILVPGIGQHVWVTELHAVQVWTGSSWAISYAVPQRAAGLSATPPVTTDASLSVLLTSLGTLTSGATYRLTGLIRVTGGTCKLTSIGALTGVWGNTVDGSDAAVFDQTSADASITLVQGLNQIVGEVTASSSGMWSIYSYYGVSAVIDAVSFLQYERTA